VIWPKDLAHPVIASNMALYPEIAAGHVSEVWEALRWREFDRALLNPMWTSNWFKQFYIDEVAQLTDGSFVMPLMWVTKKGVVHAECYDLTILEVRFYAMSTQALPHCNLQDGTLHLPSKSLVKRLVPAVKFATTYVELACGNHVKFSGMLFLHQRTGPS
jgi:hypothetical protein